jgi:chlorobactene glucosyltransferase
VLHAFLVFCAGYAALCLVMTFVNAAAVPRLSREKPAGADAPFLSIVVPARNEERAVAAAVRSFLAQDYPRFEVVVVDDRSTDGTAAILSEIARADPRLIVVAGAEPPPGWLGKPHALHQGAARAGGDLLLFVDADVRYDSRAASEAVGFLERRGLDFAALLPRFESAGFWEPVLMANLNCAIYFGPGFLVNAPRPRWFAAGGGAGNLVRRGAYEAIGGHAALRASVVDDVRLAVETKLAGFRVGAAIGDDRISVRMYRGFREVWNGFTKNVAFAAGGLMGTAMVVLALLWTAVSVVPPVAAVAWLLGAAIPGSDAALAAAAWALLAAARVSLAAVLHEPLWTAATQPVMAVVWMGILVRSAWYRFIRRSVVWRGRTFDARKAGF